MRASDLRMLADSMGVADEVTVEVGARIAEMYWHRLARTTRPAFVRVH